MLVSIIYGPNIRLVITCCLYYYVDCGALCIRHKSTSPPPQLHLFLFSSLNLRSSSPATTQDSFFWNSTSIMAIMSIGSFATFLIVCRKSSLCPNQDRRPTASPPYPTQLTNDNKNQQQHVSSWASSSPFSPTTTQSFGPPPQHPPRTTTTSKPTSASSTPPHPLSRASST